MFGVSPIERVTPLDKRCVEIQWADRSISTHDLTPLIKNRRSMLPLRTDDQLFHSVEVGDEGRSLVWQPDLAIAVSSILRLPNNAMSPREFIRISEEVGLSVEALASLLGASRRLISCFRSGERPIPPMFALAMRYVETMMGRS